MNTRPKSKMYMCVCVHLLCNLQDLLCFLFLFIPLSILPFWWSMVLTLWGPHGSCLVPWKNDPGDKILGKLLRYNHTGCVWLIFFLFLDTLHKWDYLLIPIWKGVLLSDSVLWVTLPHILISFYNTLVLLAEVSNMRGFVWVHLRNPTVEIPMEILILGVCILLHVWD
jgi:hypothetical protein